MRRLEAILRKGEGPLRVQNYVCAKELFRKQFEIFFITSSLYMLFCREYVDSIIYLNAKHLKYILVARFPGNPYSLMLKQLFSKCPYKISETIL